MSVAYEAHERRLRAAAYEAKAIRERKTESRISLAFCAAYGLALILAAFAVAATH